MERNGFEIELRVLNDCTSKYPGLTFVGYYNIYPEKKKPYRLEDYFEFIHGKEHVDIGGYLKNGIKRGLGKIFDKHHDEVVDMYTGLVVSAHDNYRTGILGFDVVDKKYYQKTPDDVGYGDYVEEW